MPTTDSQLNYILEQLSFVPEVRSKKMFGEYGLYSQNIYFGLVCDYKLFLKTSKKLVELIGDDGQRAYPGSKNSLHVPEEIIEDRDQLVKILALALS
jgi:DNA transformation protein and related proteins